MKITCNSCGAKYTIADEKVGGRRVKVRCKNCKASILVDGTGGSGEAGGEADSEMDAGEAVEAAPAEAAKKPPERKTVKKNTWSVNLSDDDSREMTTDELVQGWKDGSVTQDAYVWKDGLEDWKPILDVPELKLRLKAVTPKKEEELVTSSKRSQGKSDDLFGGADFGSGKPSPAAALAPSTSDDDKKAAATGARNESSVLFSLDALRSNEPAKEDKTAAADIFGPSLGGGGGGFGGGGFGGGLGGGIDLLTAPAKDPPPAPVGARAAAAPTAVAPSSGGGSKTGLIIGAVIGVLVLAGGAFLVFGGKDDAAAVAAAQAEAEKKALEEKLSAADSASKKAIEEARLKSEAEKKALEDKLKAAEAKPGEAKPADKPPETTAATAKPGETKPAETKPAETKPTAPAGGGAFDTAAAKAALAAAAANVASCAQPGGPTGSGKVEITFAPSGRVTSANVVSGPFGGTPVGGCIASTFRRAKVPAFSGDPVTVAKSFSIN